MDTVINRRHLLRSLGLSAGATVLGAFTPRITQAQSALGEAKPAEDAPWFELGILDDPIQNNQLLHYLAATYSGQADIGEVLDTAHRIKSNDEWSWPTQWIKTAERLRDMADASLTRGHRLSSGQAYLRAANYFRAALIHHPEPKDPSVLSTGRKSVQAFDKAIKLLGLPAQAVRIPYERSGLPGYFFRSPLAKGKAPVLIMHQGRDAWPEESKYIADAALARGYHCLMFHGPGQGMAIREQQLAFRPDWEKVVMPVVDFAIRQTGVDPSRIALMGLSMGGALAPRAAAFEKRIKILIANPGVLNWGEAMFDQFNQLFPEIMQLLEKNPNAFDAAMGQVMQQVPLYRWYMKDSMHKHGSSTASELMVRLKSFNNETIVDRITCRTLVMDGTAEGFSVGQAKKLFDALRGPKEYMLFSEQDTGLLHCQEGAQAVANHRMFDWLDQYL